MHTPWARSILIRRGDLRRGALGIRVDLSPEGESLLIFGHHGADKGEFTGPLILLSMQIGICLCE